MPYFCGLDWGSVGHAVCVVDETGAVLLRFEVAHDAAGLAELRKKLDRLAPAADIPIAIERPSGLIVDALVEAGHTVVPIHPNVVKACRPRYRAAGGKSDPGDAFMLADILRTDGHRFRPLAPCSDEIKALRALVRGRDELVASGSPWPTACVACWTASGPAPPPSSPTSTRPSRWPSCSVTPLPSRQRALAKSG
jgi:hypothetical protein